jgi:hypothetical protein
MKKLKETAAMKVKLFNAMVRNHSEQYWRYYMMWHERGNLADTDLEKFTKLESESGSAMWDDPPEDWSERDLAIWSMGNAHGREVECGNVSGMMMQLEELSSELINNDYGFRKGIPTLNQVEMHAHRNLMGFWMVLIDNKGNDDFVTRFPVMEILQVAKDKIQIWDESKGKYINLTKKEQKRMLEFMPVNMGGMPSSWNKLKTGKK